MEIPDTPAGNERAINADEEQVVSEVALRQELAGVDMAEVMPWTDGLTLVPLANGARRQAPGVMENAAQASYAPLVGLRHGKWKIRPP